MSFINHNVSEAILAAKNRAGIRVMVETISSTFAPTSDAPGHRPGGAKYVLTDLDAKVLVLQLIEFPSSIEANTLCLAEQRQGGRGT